MGAKTKEFAGIAAAVAGRCQKCFSHHYNEAKRLTTEKNDIKVVIELAMVIRGAGDTSMDEFVGLPEK